LRSQSDSNPEIAGDRRKALAPALSIGARPCSDQFSSITPSDTTKAERVNYFANSEYTSS